MYNNESRQKVKGDKMEAVIIGVMVIGVVLHFLG